MHHRSALHHVRANLTTRLAFVILGAAFSMSGAATAGADDVKAVYGFSATVAAQSEDGLQLRLRCRETHKDEVERCFDADCKIRERIGPFCSEFGTETTLATHEPVTWVRAPELSSYPFTVKAMDYPGQSLNVASIVGGHAEHPEALRRKDNYNDQLRVLPQTTSLLNNLPMLLKHKALWLPRGTQGLSASQVTTLEAYVRRGGLVVSSAGALHAYLDGKTLRRPPLPYALQTTSSSYVKREAGAVPAVGAKDGAGAWVEVREDASLKREPERPDVVAAILHAWLHELHVEGHDAERLAADLARMEALQLPSRGLLLTVLLAWTLGVLVLIRRHGSAPYTHLLGKVAVASIVLTGVLFGSRYLMAPSEHSVFVHVIRGAVPASSTPGVEHSVVEARIHVTSLLGHTATIDNTKGELHLVGADERVVYVETADGKRHLTGAALQPVVQVVTHAGSAAPLYDGKKREFAVDVDTQVEDVYGNSGWVVWANGKRERTFYSHEPINERLSDADNRVRIYAVERARQPGMAVAFARADNDDLHVYLVEGDAADMREVRP